MIKLDIKREQGFFGWGRGNAGQKTLNSAVHTMDWAAAVGYVLVYGAVEPVLGNDHWPRPLLSMGMGKKRVLKWKLPALHQKQGAACSWMGLSCAHYALQHPCCLAGIKSPCVMTE